MIRREYHPSSRIDALILKKKLEEGAKSAEEEADRTKFIDRVVGGLERDEALHESNGNITTVEQLDVEDHPERNIPDIPENKRVRDFLRSMPLTGHGAAFGKTIYVVQCYRCKCYGHRAGDPECKYTVTGDLNLELQSRIREDPIRSFKPLQEQRSNSKVERMKQLLQEAKLEQAERVEHAERAEHADHSHSHSHSHHSDSEHRHRRHHRHKHRHTHASPSRALSSDSNQTRHL